MPHDPYDALFDEIVAEWADDEDAECRRYYPNTNPKENNR